MQRLPCAYHAKSVRLALRPKRGRQDHRDSPGIAKEVKSCVGIFVKDQPEYSIERCFLLHFER